MAYKSLVCSLLVLVLLLLSSLSSSSARILQDSLAHSRSHILPTTDDNVSNKKETDVSVGVKRINGATNYNMAEDVKKCDEAEVKIGVNNVEGSKKKQFPGEEEDVVQEAGFVAFNADYHTPRHHPPKNN